MSDLIVVDKPLEKKQGNSCLKYLKNNGSNIVIIILHN